MLKREDDLIHGGKVLKETFRTLATGTSFQTCQNVGRKEKNFCLDNVLGKMGQLNKYRLKAVKSKKLRNTISFPFTNSASRAFSHSQNRCHFWKCRIAEHQKKKKISILQEYGCAFFLFAGRKHVCLEYQLSLSSAFALENKNFLVQLQSSSKMVSQKSN